MGETSTADGTDVVSQFDTWMANETLLFSKTQGTRRR